jgi:hypothetical protein
VTGARLTPLDARFWRMVFHHHAENILAPAPSLEGRSHYSGQPALYLSETPEGCAVAIKRYRRPDDPSRVVVPLRVQSSRIVDLRDPVATAALGIDTTHRAIEWQDFRARGEPSPTWVISDRVRALGLDGMLYASRTQPDLTHLTLFAWNAPGAASITQDGPPEPAP